MTILPESEFPQTDSSQTESQATVDPNRTDFQINSIPKDPTQESLESCSTKTFYWPGRDNDVCNGKPIWKGLKFCEPRLASTIDAATNSGSPGRYLLGSEIGRGGVGVVHEGWDTKLERETAIKILLEEHKEKPEVVRRFLEEARITSCLQHPGVVAIHDSGWSEDERPFFVMRLVRGRTLEHILQRRADVLEDLPRMLSIFLQVCQAVAYSHKQGIIHRDLKPANVMVGSYGVVKVMDWGLAKVLGEPDLPDAQAAAMAAAELNTRRKSRDPTEIDSNQTGTKLGTVFGTPAYLPPEQARGEIDRIDQQTDVFALGCILSEILTGAPPYTGANGREVYEKAVMADTSEVLARLNVCLAPLDLISLAKWCLCPELCERPRDGGNVVEVLIAHLHSDQRRAERDLVRFFDLSLELFCIASMDGYFLRVNKNFPRVLGYSAEELTSHPFLDFVHPDDLEKTNLEVVRLANGEPCIQFLNRYRHADGHYIWFEWSAQTAPEERAIYAVARDVSERVHKLDDL